MLKNALQTYLKGVFAFQGLINSLKINIMYYELPHKDVNNRPFVEKNHSKGVFLLL